MKLFNKSSIFFSSLVVLAASINISATTVDKPLKIGFISKEKILLESKHAQNFQKEINKMLEIKGKELDKHKKEFMAKQETLAKDKDILSEKEFAAKVSKLQAEHNSLQEEEMEIKEDLEKNSQKYNKKIEELVDDAVDAIVKEHSLDIVLASEASMHYDSKFDYTKQLLKIMDSKFKK